MATHCSLLAWKIPWTEELGGLQTKGSQIISNSCVSPQERKTITCFSTVGYLVIIRVVILVTFWRFLILLYLPLYCAAHQVKH